MLIRIKKKNLGLIFFIAIALISFMSIISYTYGAPTGASLTNVSTTQKGAANPDWNNGTKGAIHIVRLTAEQQNIKWKAYVGNVSSTFVLDDSDDYSIYQWTITSFTGQVYITRDGSVTWGTVDCANITNKEAEDTAIDHTSTSEDSVNSTFTSTSHRDFTVASNPITDGDCFSTATWANDTTQSPSATTPFTEVLLWDSTGGDMIYTTFVENDASSYRNDTASTNVTYDFQAIVPEDGDAVDPTLTYYFYLELTSN